MGTLGPMTPGGGWKPLRIGGGGWLTGISIADDGTKVVRADSYGAYIWDSDHWRQLVTPATISLSEYEGEYSSGGGVYSIAVAPSNSDIIYMVWNGFVWKSTNKGVTFSKTSFTQRTNMDPNDLSYRTWGDKMIVDPINPDVVYVGTPTNGLYTTSDGGANWSAVGGVTAGSAPGHCGLAFDRAGGTSGGKTLVIYAGSCGNGVYRSADSGANWSLLDGSPTLVSHAMANDGYYCTASLDVAWKYVGGSWTDVSPRGMCDVLLRDPGNANNLLILLSGSQRVISTDGGANWSSVQYTNTRTATDIPWLAWTNESYMSLGNAVFDPTDTTKLWTAEGIGVWSTTWAANINAATAWTSQTTGIEQMISFTLWSVPGGALWAGSWDRPFFRITDPDAFPTRHYPDSPGASILLGYSIESAADDDDFLVCNVSYKTVGTDASSYSSDAGLSWTRLPSIPPVSGIERGGHIAVSTSTNWVWAPYGGNNGAKVYYTKDGGTNWTVITLPAPFDGGNSEATGWGGFSMSNDLNRHVVCADRVTTGTFYLYHMELGVYRSTDSGDTWTRVHTGTLQTVGLDYWNGKLKAVPGHAGHVMWTAGDASGAGPQGVLLRSTDGGANWSAVANVGEPKDFGFGKEKPGGSYPTIFIAGWISNVWGYWYSDDEMATWHSIGTTPWWLDYPACVSGDMNTYGRFYVGMGGSGYVYYG